MEKIDARKLSTDAQQELRYQVIRLRKQGRSHREISTITGVFRSTCSTWWNVYKKQGKKALKIQKRGRPTGSCRNLLPEQEKEIQKAIRDKCPDQLKLPFALWTRIAVQELIRQRWGLEIPIRTIGDYLKRWNFSPQKPLKRAYEQNPKAVSKWLDEEYPAIKQKAKTENAEIHWGDETGLCNDSYHGRGYAPRGKTPVISLSAKKCERVNLISTITNQGKVRFMVYKDRLNADTFIRFMKRLIKDADRKLFLILDNLKVHHSYKVRDWLLEHEEQIEVFFLPSYSPELNPDEYLNCDLKAGVHSGPPARTREQLKNKAISHLKKLQKMPRRVMKYFKYHKIPYAA
jgi:transposase